jgi:hypothetical protein
MTLATAIQRGTRAAQPAAASVPVATLYFVTDEFVLERSSGSAWQSESAVVLVGDSGAGGTRGLVPAPAAGDAAAGKFLKADGTWTAPTGSAGKLVQVVNTQTGAVSTGTTIIPHDDTIPQNTEGDQYMSLAITPTNATNKLKIEVVVYAGTSGASQWMAAALFQDSTANALAAGNAFDATATAIPSPIVFTHYMTAGTTSATTFKVRAGASAAGTTTFNGQTGGRIFGGVMASSITISEIVP